MPFDTGRGAALTAPAPQPMSLSPTRLEFNP